VLRVSWAKRLLYRPGDVQHRFVLLAPATFRAGPRSLVFVCQRIYREICELVRALCKNGSSPGPYPMGFTLLLYAC
jgi:hypothetical protein